MNEQMKLGKLLEPDILIQFENILQMNTNKFKISKFQPLS
jgi:hypothetical protein